MSFNHLLTAVLAAALASAAQPDVIYVDDDNCPGPGSGTEADPYCMILLAINAAVDTDEIVVAPGTYFETINFLGKAISLRSSGGPQVTVIDAQCSGTVVTCSSGEGPDTVLNGFTITNGVGLLGGGMFNSSSSPTVTNCTFINNDADAGGGMFNHNNSDPAVTSCTFAGNFAVIGGGMANDGNSDPTVANCRFSGNSAGNGGGMFNWDSSPALASCTFSGNSAGNGGGMYNRNSNPTLANCTFSGNDAGRYGGGMYNWDSSEPSVINCTFSHNDASGGGGMHNDDSSPTVANCILWDNHGGQIESWSSSETVTFSNVQGGWPGPGNIDIDPWFVGGLSGTWTDDPLYDEQSGQTTYTDANASLVPDDLVGKTLNPDTGPWSYRQLLIVANTETTIMAWGNVRYVEAGDTYQVYDYHLLPGSPCVDAGDNTAVPVGIRRDLDGNPRFVVGSSLIYLGIGPIVDIGAYEYQFDPIDRILLRVIDGSGAAAVTTRFGTTP